MESSSLDNTESWIRSCEAAQIKCLALPCTDCNRRTYLMHTVCGALDYIHIVQSTRTALGIRKWKLHSSLAPRILLRMKVCWAHVEDVHSNAFNCKVMIMMKTVNEIKWQLNVLTEYDELHSLCEHRSGSIFRSRERLKDWSIRLIVTTFCVISKE